MSSLSYLLLHALAMTLGEEEEDGDDDQDVAIVKISRRDKGRLTQSLFQQDMNDDDDDDDDAGGVGIIHPPPVVGGPILLPLVGAG